MIKSSLSALSFRKGYGMISMNNLFSYYVGELNEFVSEALAGHGPFIKRVISKVSASLVEDLYSMGVVVDASWKHTLDNSAVRHAMKTHGSSREELRGQIPITKRDLLLIPYIVECYDLIRIEKNRRGQDVIIYSKAMNDGVTYYVEEVRLGRHELAASTLYKRKKENSPTLMD